MEPTWHDGLSRKALVELVEGLLLAMDKSVPRLDAVAHHLSLMSQQGEELEVLGGISDQMADIADELDPASDREKLREWGNEIDATGKAHWGWRRPRRKARTNAVGSQLVTPTVSSREARGHLGTRPGRCPSG